MLFLSPFPKISPAMAGQRESPTSSKSRPTRVGEKRGHSDSEEVPEKTSEWEADAVCNTLQISLRDEDDPRSLFIIGYHRFMGRNIQHKDFMRKHFETPDQEYLVKQACLEFIFCKWKNMINCELITDINAADAFRMNQELNKAFSESAFTEFLEKEEKEFAFGMCDESFLHKAQSMIEEKKQMWRETCQKMYTKLKLFSDQLLCVINNKKNPSERMIQDLFMAFVRIFDLTIFDTTNSPNSCYRFQHGKKIVRSEPDAVILINKLSSEMELESRVIAVVKVQKDYSKFNYDEHVEPVAEEEPEDKKKRLRSGSINPVPEIAEHISSKVKGQHIGEMVAVAQSSSMFGQNGIFGFIVQGTKVTLVSLEARREYFENLLIKDKPKDLRAEVTYSKECNFLSKDGRKQLIPIFLAKKKASEISEKTQKQLKDGLTLAHILEENTSKMASGKRETSSKFKEVMEQLSKEVSVDETKKQAKKLQTKPALVDRKETGKKRRYAKNRST